MLSHSTPV
uniref:Uncharacterized protein n=1 Tax=Anguilla anguilla TaxID=7936 RepID=A0A0E9UUD7_ANGAN